MVKWIERKESGPEDRGLGLGRCEEAALYASPPYGNSGMS
jgi:hypothetical protein